MSKKTESKQPTGETLASEERALLRTQRTEIARLTRAMRKAEQERDQVSADRDRLIAAERLSLYRALVHAGRPPATVWADPSGTAARAPLERMSVEELRAEVALEKSLPPRLFYDLPRPPGSGASLDGDRPRYFSVDGRQIEVTARELRICAEQGCEPKTFAVLKAKRDGGAK